MRKSTVIAMAILAVGFGSMLFLFDAYTSRFRDEILHAKELTKEMKASLAPDTQIRLARVVGGSKYVVHDADRSGLLVEASPSKELWARDASGMELARPLAVRLFEIYAGDRPIRWLQIKLFLPDGTQKPVLGFEPLEGGGLAPIEADKPASK